MLEPQVRCFTCNSVINPKMRLYAAYRRDLKLSRSDAADKAQLFNMCCRTTTFAQTGVEERMYAAGRLETVNNVKVVREVSDYPEIKPVRVEKEGPYKFKTVQLAPKFDQVINSFQSYGGINPGIKKVPEAKVAFSFRPPEPKVPKRTNKLSLINDISSYPNKIWSLSDISTFPQEDLETPFCSKAITVALKTPLLESHTVTLKFEAHVKTVEALEVLRTAVLEPRAELFQLAIESPEVLTRPDVLDIVLKDAREGQNVTMFELNKGSMVVKKVSYRRDTQVYTFEFEHAIGRIRVAETDFAAGKMGISIIEDATEAKIMSKVRRKAITTVNMIGSHIIVTLGKTELSFSDFEVKTALKIENGLEAITIGAKIVGVKSTNNLLLLALKSETDVRILSITGYFDLKATEDIADQAAQDLAYKQAFAKAFDL